MCQKCVEQFAHLHCHSEYSLLDGLSRVNDLVERAAELNQPAVALTDHGAMYGVMDFYRAAKSASIKPIIGIETYIAARGMTDRDSQLDKERFHLLLLAQNQTGYQNLLEMASISQLEGYYYKPRVDHDVLAQFGAGIISTTGCLAAKVPQALMHGREQEAHRLMGEYLDIFGRDNFFIELQEHSIPALTEVNKKLIEMAPQYGLQNNFLITNDVHYTRAEDADPHQVLLCIQTSSTMQNPKMTFSDKGYYLKSYDELVADFTRLGYAHDIIQNGMANSLRIVEMCDVSLDSEGYHLPQFDVPEGHDAHSYLRHLCEKGLHWRYGAERAQNDPALRQRLEHELGIINRMGFDTYFLIVWDLCEWAVRSDEWWAQYQDPFPYSDYGEWKRNDIWWNVRGSGAGSVVAYTLGITSIDPLANGLIFERFLNPGRVSMPDIDLDYPDDVRHWMVAYTKRRYGNEKVAQIITYGTMGARAAIRDVGRALDMPLPEVDSVARMIPAVPGKPVKIKNVLDPEHEFYSRELEERVKSDTAVRTLIETAQGLEGITRHASSHAAGVIVSDRPLHEYVPLNRPTSGEEGLGGVDRVTQWPMEIVESIGLLKVDFLGLSTLTVMRQAARLIEQRHGVSYTMDNIPYDMGHAGPDPAKNPAQLFDMLGRGEVAGVFQVEGGGMKKLMMEMKPRRFDHIIAAISLYRPGPMENIPEYIRRMHSDIYDGKDIVKYHTPDLKPILEDTYGILVYQEQIIRIASDLAGYEPGEADMIRKAVSKKKRALIDEHRVQFTKGAMARGYSQQVCDAIWGDIEFFARYGFNKCLPGDVEVLDAATGRLVRIEDLYHGRVQLQHTITCDTETLQLQEGAVTAVLNNGVKPIYRLTTSLGKQIEATDNHPFYTFEGWRLLGELEVGQPIAVPRMLPAMGKTIWPEHEVIALAHLLAEGNLCHPHSVYYYTQSDTSLQDYVQAAEQFPNVTCTVATHKATYSVYAKRTDKTEEPGIVPWAKALGIWGKNALEKEIPAEVFTLQNEQLALLLGRMWDGDGSFGFRQNAYHAYYATSSERLARQIQHLLLRLGIMSNFRAQHFAYKEGRIGYQIHVMGGEHLAQFASLVGQYFLREDWLTYCAELTAVSTPNLLSKDIIPVQIKTFVRQEKDAANLTWNEFRQATGTAPREFYPTKSAGKRGFRRETISQLADYFDSSELRRYAESDLYWDPIVAIEYIGEKQTYDLTIDETHNFIANDILVHNSHAADYAKVTCQTAFLKAHYPVEYLTAMLSVERDNSDKVRFYFAEAKNLGIDVAPPDVNRSQLDFTIEDEADYQRIRFGLGAIKNAGATALNLIVAEREENGPFNSLQDLCERVDLRRVGKRALEFMIKGRAFDLWGTPPQMLDALDRIVAESGRHHDAAAAGQMSLFGGLTAAPKFKVKLLKPVAELDEDIPHKQILEWEKEALGVHVSEHPLERPLRQMASYKPKPLSQVDALLNGKSIRVAGVLSQFRTITTKKGDPMAFGTLEDLEGKIDLVFFPRTWQEVRDQVTVDQVMLVTGKVNVKEGEVSILVDKILTKFTSNGNGDTPAAPAPPQQTSMLAGGNPRALPEPPEEEMGTSSPTPPAPKPQPHQPARVASAPPTAVSAPTSPPPPPAFEPDWQNDTPPSDWDDQPHATPYVGDLPPRTSREPQPTSQQTNQPTSQPTHKPTNGHTNGNGNGNGYTSPPAYTIIVELSTQQGNWRRACQELLNTAAQFNGRDQFYVKLPEHNLKVHFPQHNTKYCPALTAELERVSGVLRVGVRE